MNPQFNHLAKNAQTALKEHLKEQEDSKKALLREQQMRDLHQFEKKLFHKQEELKRVKAELDRLRAEAVAREKEFKNSILGVQQKNHITDLENKIKIVDDSVKHKIDTVAQKIQQNQRLFENKKKELLTYEAHARSLQGQAKQNPDNTVSVIQKLEQDIHTAHQSSTQRLTTVVQKIHQTQTLFENKKRELLMYESQIKEIQAKIAVLKKETDVLAQMHTGLLNEKTNLSTSLQKGDSSKAQIIQNLKYKNKKEKIEFDAHQKELKIAETKIAVLKKETDVLAQMHTSLLNEKEHLVLQGEQQKKNLSGDIQRTQSILQSAQQRVESEKKLFENTHRHIVGLEQALKSFTQDISVIDNKIRALKSTMR